MSRYNGESPVFLNIKILFFYLQAEWLFLSLRPMSKKIVIFLYLLALSCCGIASEVFFQEDFENENGPIMDMAEFSAGAVSDATGKDAISGNRSLLLNTMGQSGWPRSIRLFKNGLPNNYLYKVSFKYKVLEVSKSSGNNFLVVESFDSGKTRRISTSIFGSNAGDEGLMEAVFMANVPKNEKIIVDFTSSNGSKILLDDIKFERSSMPESSRWFFDEGVFKGMRYNPTYSEFMFHNPNLFKMSKEEFFPFVDKYGQFKHKDWPGKIKSDTDFADRIAEEKKFNASNPPIEGLDQYGGYIMEGKNCGKSKHFRVKKIRGKWFFITPEGNIFWSLGIDSVGSFATTPIDGRENYFEDISDKKYVNRAWWGKFDYEKPHNVYNFGRRNVEIKYDKFSDLEHAKFIGDRCRHWGINTLGAWTNSLVLENSNVAYAFFMSTSEGCTLDSKMKLEGYWSAPRDFFDPKFEESVKNVVARNAKFLTDSRCIGTFFDNELPWQNNVLDIPKSVLTCPETQFAKIAFWDFLQKKYSDISALNKAWNSKYADWDSFLKERDFIPSTKEAESDMLAFEEIFYEKYFKTCRDAIKSVDPEVLYFGCRFAWVNPMLPRVASKYCDVVCYNLYRTSVADFKMPEGTKDVPVIIGEYHFGSSDMGVIGAGLCPRRNVDAVVDAYTKYTIGAIENPLIVGAHWFQWSDQSVTGRSDGENYRIGFVDICDTPAYPIIEAARNISENMYKMRLSGKKTTKAVKEKTITY